MSVQRDPYLDVALDGVQLIQASAGTGKTFTLATLVLRLVVERGLSLGQILAVTYTVAATQELRRRIRERLQLAHDLVGAPPPDPEDAERTTTWTILQQHQHAHGETNGALQARLHLAVLDIDLAAIFTIHGFCTRVLRDHALETGQAFAPRELLTNQRALHATLAADLWRTHGQQTAGAEDLIALWNGGPDALAQDLHDLLEDVALLPAAPEGDPDVLLQQDRVEAAATALLAVWSNEGEAFLDRLDAAVQGGVLNKNSYRREWIADLRNWLQQACPATRLPSVSHPKLFKLTQPELDKGTKKEFKDQTPQSGALGAAVQEWLAADAALAAAREARRIALLHTIRDDARVRLRLHKDAQRVQTYDDLIEQVAAALAGEHGAALQRRLREQYQVALVDEFQDTDARQWSIFQRVFGLPDAAPGLFLIGDPKQAIYGFRGGDVRTYLDAASQAATAAPLTRNFRSRPVLLETLSALYATAPQNPFHTEGIAFEAVHAGGNCKNADYLLGGVPAPALTLWQAPAVVDENGEPTGKSHSASASRALATAACVDAIGAVLDASKNEAAALRDRLSGAPRAVLPGDIAVLVRTNKEAMQLRQALVAAGIPAVAAGRQSLYATEQAQEMLTVLLALVHAGDTRRLHAALATMLLGQQAGTIAELAQDESGHGPWFERFADWQERLARGGPLALFNDLCAERAPRLMCLFDGERRVSNYLQLAEALQEQQAATLGLRGLADWLEHAIATADANDDTQQLRLESDTHRVQIVTLHKSKGLEYPLVFLPFAGIGNRSPTNSHLRLVRDTDGVRRLHWKTAGNDAQWKQAGDTMLRESKAEDARLLYVGLTRAQHALWIACGPLHDAGKAALHDLLPGLLADPATLPSGVVLSDGAAPAPAAAECLRPLEVAQVLPAREAVRSANSDWWVHSFSQLSRADGGSAMEAATVLPASGNDEPDEPDEPSANSAPETNRGSLQERGPAGRRFGVALHAALETTDFSIWRNWMLDAPAPPGAQADISAALRDQGYLGADAEAGLTLATRLIGQTLTVALPEGLRLCELASADCRPEIEFQFSLRSTRVEDLLELLHAYGVVRPRSHFGARRRLQGLMTGKIDLTYRHGGRWYLIDYKTNRLSAYAEADLQQAMAHSEYDLQALIYTLALHRWLGFRLGEGYDYARDFGGVRYLFCRGLDAARSPTPGVHAWRFEAALVHALDALLGRESGTEGAA